MNMGRWSWYEFFVDIDHFAAERCRHVAGVEVGGMVMTLLATMWERLRNEDANCAEKEEEGNPVLRLAPPQSLVAGNFE